MVKEVMVRHDEKTFFEKCHHYADVTWKHEWFSLYQNVEGQEITFSRMSSKKEFLEGQFVSLEF